MARRCKGTVLRGAAALLAAALLLSIPSAPASAAGLFESFFNGLGRVLSGGAPRVPAYADPHTAQPAKRQERVIDRGPSGPRQAFCVRTCDGGYFPVRAHAGMSVADACRSFCPACETRLYYGGSIDHAVARDGSRYADLPNAYLYRKHLVAGCSCNDRSTPGVASIEPKSDPTLRRGDVVATQNGLVVYSGGRGEAKNFTPVESYRGISKSERARLSELKVTPSDRRGTAAASVLTPVPATAWHLPENRTAQR